MGYALITGASEGIGKELARCAAKDGYDVILAARSKDKLTQLGKALENEYGISCIVVTSDLSMPNAAAKLWSEASQDREIDIVINNAGIGSHGPFSETDWQRELDLINVNVVALTDLMKRAIQHMKGHGGRGKIMNVASTAAFMSGPRMAVYHASKSYVLSLTEAVAEEEMGGRILISALCPGVTKTEFFNAADMKGVRITKMGMAASATDVATTGWRALKAGKRIEVPGLMNKLTAFLPRVLPRRLITLVTKQLFVRKH